MGSIFPQKENKLAAPLLKWVGGKRQLAPALRALFPEERRIKNYIEPFVGGGGMFLSLQPQRAVINDFNKELMNVYQVVKDQPKELFAALERHTNTLDHYYEVREQDRASDYAALSQVEKAARIIFLNKTCFNGLFRVNSQGFFNVPYGYYKNPQYREYSKIMALSHYLNHNAITMLSGDYSVVGEYITPGTLVYLDPPYAPISDTSNFTGYTQSGFSIGEQVRLRDFCVEIGEKGAYFMLSNSNSPLIKELYADFQTHQVKAQRNVAANAASRGAVEEIVITNY